MDRLGTPSILVVEDDPDIREMLATLLDVAGFGVVVCDTAEGALKALRQESFDLLLTDYALPRQSGLWLLEQAEAEGLLEGTPALIVTAHPSVSGGAAYEVIQKPFDLDQLMDRVKYRVGGGGARRHRQASPHQSDEKGDGEPAGGAGGCPRPIELILYVAAPSPRTHEVVMRLTKALEQVHKSRAKVTVYDLSAARGGDRVIPTLLRPGPARRIPCPRTWVMGHITNPDLLLELLADAEFRES